MTSPTLREMDMISQADPYIRAALEFIWAFTEWWDTVDPDYVDQGDPGTFRDMERAYERWWNQR